MSAAENPVDTVIRLLSRNMRVAKEDGTPANIYVSREWFDRELFKNYDGQVTVGLAESRDVKVETSGRIRMRKLVFRVNVWSLNAFVRQQMVDEINRIVRLNRHSPGEEQSGTDKAYSAGSASEPPLDSDVWNELSQSDYEKIGESDDSRYSLSRTADGEHALMRFRFKVGVEKENVKTLVPLFEGYGVAPEGDGVNVKVWSYADSAWASFPVERSGECFIFTDFAPEDYTVGDEVYSLNVENVCPDYIGEDGCVWFLAETAGASDGSSPAVLYCDWACGSFTVCGLSYLDVAGYRDLDLVTVKPYVYRTEFRLEGWMFEEVEP